MMTEDGDLRLVARKLVEAPGRKTPDFEVLDAAGDLFAYCEVKSPRDDFLEKLWALAPPGQHTVGGARPDPVFNRIARQIIRAQEQLEAQDPTRRVPRIVAIVNHDRACGVADLVETITGRRPGISLKTQPLDPKFLADVLPQIDAVLWMNADMRTRPTWFFTEPIPEYFHKLQDAFGLKGIVRF
jgi:hypothetical protein